MSVPAFDSTACPPIFELGQPGRANRYLEPGKALTQFLPEPLLRAELPLPDNSELDVVRHYTKLSSRTFGIDLGFYPLGSCTMKYNPRVNDAIAAQPEFAGLHPYVPDELAQGALQIMYELERSLSSLFGMAAFSLNPSAGAHAELGALLIAKRYFKDRGETGRDKVIVPDTAHGTNPASAAMCGFKVISLPSDERGRVSVTELKKVLGPDTAVCMMTNPNTLGLFEDHVLDITAAVHAAGGLMYYDGANANALMGNTRPGDMGFDLMHLNTHKTFTIPHGGRRRHPKKRRRRPGFAERPDVVSPRFRPPEVDRADALVLVELRSRRSSAGVSLRQRRGRP